MAEKGAIHALMCGIQRQPAHGRKAATQQGAGQVAQRLYDTLYGMQTGTVPDDMGWTYPLGF